MHFSKLNTYSVSYEYCVDFLEVYAFAGQFICEAILELELKVLLACSAYFLCSNDERFICIVTQSFFTRINYVTILTSLERL